MVKDGEGLKVPIRIKYIRAAAPAADPGKMGKEETARLTFPICVCRVVYVCLYVYTMASLQTKKQASRKNVFFPTFSVFSISHQLTCCCCCCCPKAPPGTKTAVAAAAAANRRVARAPPGTKTARHGRTNMPQNRTEKVPNVPSEFLEKMSFSQPFPLFQSHQPTCCCCC